MPIAETGESQQNRDFRFRPSLTPSQSPHRHVKITWAISEGEARVVGALTTGSPRYPAAGHPQLRCFPYSDTLKVLEKWGLSCCFFGAGVDDDLSGVRRVAQEAAGSGSPIIALFCEVSTSPLLRTPNLVELRKIADELDFLIVVDESIGNFVNVDVTKSSFLMLGDLTTRSFEITSNRPTKTSSGTMMSFAWKLTRGTSFTGLKSSIGGLQHRSWQDSKPDRKTRVITNVFYPKWVMRENYDACRRRPASSTVTPRYPSGFGGFFTIVFSDEPAAKAFYDNLGCEKGPGWGMNFTFACPHTILAHHRELDWAAEYGAPINILQISIGMEDEETMLGWVRYALEAAEKAVVS
ncbi:hypothetical protein M407DRAFT_210596 [Tulasnella calospora MUT 4182]|uniref:Uncharacterized protein n=1 Tax=Tulasnella calospora MUT 4182 TaxID=1051891 RepID=A0A0C3Q795_9AGAM|nr:hypothetical protein M407DRAFT_210596 [Tulasnella calospora MUT 4182]